MEEAYEIAEYFKKILKSELGINVDEKTETEEIPPTTDAIMGNEASAKTTGIIETFPSVSEKGEAIEVTPKEIAIPSEDKEALVKLSRFLEELKSMLIERIEALEKRVSELEESFRRILVSKIKVHPRTEVGTQAEELQRTFSLTSISIDNIDLLIHEARELLAQKEDSLQRLIKLEAVEWQLLKASEGDESVKSKISLDLIRALRLEINRLRKILLD